MTKTAQPIMFSKTWDMPVRMTFPEGKDLFMPGEDAQITFTMHRRMPLEKGQRFQLRDSKSTIGSGVIINMLPDLTDKEIEKLWS